VVSPFEKPTEFERIYAYSFELITTEFSLTIFVLLREPPAEGCVNDCSCDMLAYLNRWCGRTFLRLVLVVATFESLLTSDDYTY
jgi:hypothetical protein